MNWPQEEYEKQRKNRLTDSVAEYLEDDKVPAITLYQDLVSIVNELGVHYSKQLHKHDEFLSLLSSGGNGDAVPSSVECAEGFTKTWNL